jgi:Flp pilus assembly pilin Flp
MNNKMLKLAITVRSTPSRLRSSPRAATFIEYAILALMAIIIGGIILQVMTGALTTLFDNVSSFFNSNNGPGNCASCNAG